MYKSAERQTKPKRRLPKSLIFLIFFLPALLVYGWYTYTRMSAKFMEQENAEVVSTETLDNGQNPQTDGQSKGGQNYKTADNGKANLQNGQNLTPEMFVRWRIAYGKCNSTKDWRRAETAEKADAPAIPTRQPKLKKYRKKSARSTRKTAFHSIRSGNLR